MEFVRGFEPEEIRLESTEPEEIHFEELTQYSIAEADRTPQLEDLGSSEVWHQSTLPGFRTFALNVNINSSFIPPGGLGEDETLLAGNVDALMEDLQRRFDHL